jgi:hypothetical protein
MTPVTKKPATRGATKPGKPVASKAAVAGYSGKSTIDKLGIKPEHAVVVLGLADQKEFLLDLKARVGSWTPDAMRKNADVVLMRADSARDLAKLASLERSIARNGMVWVVWPKGRPELKEDHVRAAALRHGLVDVKVCAFSATLSGLKLVIPLARR